jgi:hypothetical protein
MRKNRNKAEMLISYIDNARFKKMFFYLCIQRKCVESHGADESDVGGLCSFIGSE